MTAIAKAVTLDDFAILARRAPGLPVGRAYALADHRPGFPCITAAGSVTVVVVPDCPGSKPTPGPDLLCAVERYLDRRRLVASEVHAVAPRYVGVIVRATLHLDACADPSSAVEAGRAALDQFFDPLKGGPQGTGWPAGRGVYRTEVMALLSTVTGVIRVSDVELRVDGECGARCGNIDLCPTDLVASGRHRLVARLPQGPRILHRSSEHECP